jgi:hypothetical protein
MEAPSWAQPVSVGEAWESTTRHWRCPEGEVYWRISCKTPGEPYFVEGHIAKAGGSGEYAAINAIAVLAGRLLRTGTTPAKLRQFLKGIAIAPQEAVDSGEYQAQSMADALGRTLEAYL